MDQDTRASDRWLILALSTVPVVVNLAILLTPGYGYFIDEFYYLACARRLAFGYVDHPPLAPFFLAGVRAVLGESLPAIRLLPALSVGATVYLTGLLVRRLGGTRMALVLGCLAVGLMPIILAMGSFYSVNFLEPLLWTGVMLALLRLLQTDERRLWLLIGLLIGLAFENKHTILGFVLALGVGVVLTSEGRKMLRDPWLYAGAAVAAAVALPNVLWQVANGWPSLEFYRNAQLEKNVYSPPLASLALMALTANLFTLPLWMAGLWTLLRGRFTLGARLLGLTALVVILEFVFSGSSRPDRPGATFPLLYAAGAVAVEHWARTPVRRRLSLVLAATSVLAALALLPAALPVLPPAATAKYTAALGLTHQAERGKSSPIPQLLADRTGWESFVEDVRRVYETLSEEDRKRVVIYAPSYGQAGALERWAATFGQPVPRIISHHNTYWHWSQDVASADVLIAVDADVEDLQAIYREVRRAGRVTCDYCMSWRNDIDIYIAKGEVVPLKNVWASTRHYE